MGLKKRLSSVGLLILAQKLKITNDNQYHV
jgi:hypothetical protein